MITSTAILAPVTALLLLTCAMWLWMYITRVPAVRQAGMKLDPNLPKGAQMAELPAQVRWKADNYNHLLSNQLCSTRLHLLWRYWERGRALT